VGKCVPEIRDVYRCPYVCYISLAGKTYRQFDLFEGKTMWRDGRGRFSHQVGTVSGILTVVYFKNQITQLQRDQPAKQSVGLTAKP